jgi:hypothetical protein
MDTLINRRSSPIHIRETCPHPRLGIEAPADLLVLREKLAEKAKE